MPQRIAFAHERRVVGTLPLNLPFAMFEHNEAHLKHHFDASLDTMAVGIAVMLAQLASRPASVLRLAQLLGVPRRTVVHQLQGLAAAGVLIKEGSHYVANYEVFVATDPETAAHIKGMTEAILTACEKLGHSGHSKVVVTKSTNDNHSLETHSRTQRRVADRGSAGRAGNRALGGPIVKPRPLIGTCVRAKDCWRSRRAAQDCFSSRLLFNFTEQMGRDFRTVKS